MTISWNQIIINEYTLQPEYSNQYVQIFMLNFVQMPASLS
jgi:hypothetical protein